MVESKNTRQWQVTCVCGWRTSGTKDDVVSNVMAHGKEAHGLDVTEEQAMEQAVAVT